MSKDFQYLPKSPWVNTPKPLVVGVDWAAPEANIKCGACHQMVAEARCVRQGLICEKCYQNSIPRPGNYL